MISDEYTVVLLLESSDAYANLITQAFSTTGCPHLLKHVNTAEEFRSYLSHALDEHSSEKYIRPRLILLSGDDLNSQARDLINYVKSHHLLKLIPVVVFCGADCKKAVGSENLQYINSFVKRGNNTEENRELATSLARYWLKWNNLPP